MATGETLPAASVFTSPLTGFAVTTTVTAPYGAQTLPPEAARILRTADGGHTWTVEFEKPSADFSSITAVDGHVIAVGDTMTQQQAPGPAFLVSSPTSGGSWTESTPDLPAAVTSSPPDRFAGPFGGLRLEFVTPQIGFAVGAPQTLAGSAEPLRTTDGGRTWRPFTAVESPSSIAFPTATTWVATGSSPACEGRLWISHNSGASWATLPETCEPFLLLDLAFPTPTTGYAVGGTFTPLAPLP